MSGVEVRPVAMCMVCHWGHPPDEECWNFWLEDDEGFLVQGDAERFTEPFVEVLCECEKCHPDRFDQVQRFDGTRAADRGDGGR